MIVGPGRIGRSLCGAATAAGFEVRLVGRKELAEGLAGVDPGTVGPILLAVPDAEITTACRAVLACGRPHGPLGHLSGATGLSALDDAAAAGIAVFSMHPLQTFADGETDPAGVHCAVTAADPETDAEVQALARAIGMRPFSLAEEDRGAYHAAAAMASNFLVTLEADAAGLLGKLGIGEARQMLAPLISRSLENWIEAGAAALTGPIARGDEETVDRHLEALRERAPELIESYRALAERTRAVAREASRALAETAPGETEMVAT